jgi:dTDP-4-dehydrorhamnose reductase
VRSCSKPALELWGGHECTLSRVHDRRLDQTVLSGHQDRPEDLNAFAALGLKALRYPILWERVETAPGKRDWRWCDQRLTRASNLGLKLIGGLCHHGAGPDYVDLLSEDFAPGLARHARAAAERYPWIEDWTPVNEPLTTARFSALYGHWHPHARDERSFWTALLNEIDATRLAMRDIRAVIPHAKLIQTDDLGRTYATDALSRQAEHDNERRWMGWDLLFGRVTPQHRFWSRLCRLGLEDRLRAIADDPSPPDIIGINHYLTSDRFLDHRIDNFPDIDPGGNETVRYVDVEAVRVVTPPRPGLAIALAEAWQRYGAPLAITEVHNACTREEQVRWFDQAWRAALGARERGIDVRAVTAWSLLGAYDWDSLLTQSRGRYESGVFDVSSGALRPTALAHHLRALADDQDAAPDLTAAGWWERDIRLRYRPVEVALDNPDPLAPPKPGPGDATPRPILIAGATGTLGQALARACAWRDLPYVLTSRQDMALDDEMAIAAMIRERRPRAVINATGFVRVDDAELEADACRAANTEAAVRLARICADEGVLSVTFSSDLVFDGQSHVPYIEDDTPNPLNIYGRSKAEAERNIHALAAKALVVRTAAFFSARDPHNFAAWVVRELQSGRDVECADDAVVSPTYTPALANAVLDLVLDGECGIWHLANRGAMSWAAFARAIAKASGLPAHIQNRTCEELAWRARRPANSALASSRGHLLTELDEAIWQFARERTEGQPLGL